jgi:hypothetical protein
MYIKIIFSLRLPVLWSSLTKYTAKKYSDNSFSLIITIFENTQKMCINHIQSRRSQRDYDVMDGCSSPPFYFTARNVQYFF